MRIWLMHFCTLTCHPLFETFPNIFVDSQWLLLSYLNLCTPLALLKRRLCNMLYARKITLSLSSKMS